jgi:hypothetical protein
MYVFLKTHQHPAIPEPAPRLVARVVALFSLSLSPNTSTCIPAKRKNENVKVFL